MHPAGGHQLHPETKRWQLESVVRYRGIQKRTPLPSDIFGARSVWGEQKLVF